VTETRDSDAEGAVLDPLLIDVPQRIETPRLILRCPRPGDGTALNEAECETLVDLLPWMPWAQSARTPAESEIYCRRSSARFLLREDLPMLIFERVSGAMGEEGRLLGSTGLHRMDWQVRRFEVGYWRRAGAQGRGIVTEAVLALTQMAFDQLGAQRVEIRMDDANLASRRVAERCGFMFEGLLRRDSASPQGEVRDTRVYARLRAA
jgi:RimJ/RimL family protein N-acetyltransferase